jgi:hypothetical protein
LLAPFNKEFYKKGLKPYMADKFMNFVGKENISQKVEMVDFSKMEQIRTRAE